MTVRSPQLCGIKDWTESDGSRYIVFLYKTDNFNGELNLLTKESFFGSMEKLLDLDLSPDMGDMLNMFLDDNLSEFYYHFKNGNWVYELK